jgi:hypothetical protein
MEKRQDDNPKVPLSDRRFGAFESSFWRFRIVVLALSDRRFGTFGSSFWHFSIRKSAKTTTQNVLPGLPYNSYIIIIIGEINIGLYIGEI